MFLGAFLERLNMELEREGWGESKEACSRRTCSTLQHPTPRRQHQKPAVCKFRKRFKHETCSVQHAETSDFPKQALVCFHAVLTMAFANTKTRRAIKFMYSSKELQRSSCQLSPALCMRFCRNKRLRLCLPSPAKNTQYSITPWIRLESLKQWSLPETKLGDCLSSFHDTSSVCKYRLKIRSNSQTCFCEEWKPTAAKWWACRSCPIYKNLSLRRGWRMSQWYAACVVGGMSGLGANNAKPCRSEIGILQIPTAKGLTVWDSEVLT